MLSLLLPLEYVYLNTVFGIGTGGCCGTYYHPWGQWLLDYLGASVVIVVPVAITSGRNLGNWLQKLGMLGLIGLPFAVGYDIYLTSHILGFWGALVPCLTRLVVGALLVFPLTWLCTSWSGRY